MKPRPTKKFQPWVYGEVVEQPTSRSCLVKTAMGPIRRNHAQIRGARTEPAERTIIEKDQLEIASTHSEQEQENQPANPQHMELESLLPRADECGFHPSHTGLESASPRADECRLRRSHRIRKLPSTLIYLLSFFLRERGCCTTIVISPPHLNLRYSHLIIRVIIISAPAHNA